MNLILADKITDLRKKNGWSQEELANQLGVSRQAVSKWESAVSTPDLDKILKLSALFEVSTDYLLIDSIEVENTAEEPAKNINTSLSDTLHVVSMETAHNFMELAKSAGSKIALGVSLCILSPTLLIGLTGLSAADGTALPELQAVGIGMTILLVMVATAVAIFIANGRKLSAYEFLEHQNIELAYGVSGLVTKEKSKYEDIHNRKLILGIVLCILSPVPIMIANLAGNRETILFAGVDLCLVLVSVGVFFIVSTEIAYGSFQKLLEEGEYTKIKKLRKKKDDVLGKIYWCTATALYLGWSFTTMDWEHSWIIWPVAGVLYGTIQGIASVIRHDA